MCRRCGAHWAQTRRGGGSQCQCVSCVLCVPVLCSAFSSPVSVSLPRPRPRSRHGPAHLSCPHQCPQVPPVSWHWPGPASGVPGGSSQPPGQMGTHWPCDPDWPLYLVTHTPPTHIEDYQIIIQWIFLQFAIFVPDMVSWQMMNSIKFYNSTNIVFMSVDMTRNCGSEQERQYLVHSVPCDIEVTLTQLDSGRGRKVGILCHSSKGKHDLFVSFMFF